MSVLDQVAVKRPQNCEVSAKTVSIKCYPKGGDGLFRDVTATAVGLRFSRLENRNKNAIFGVVKINKGNINLREWQLSTRLKKVFKNLLNRKFPQKGSVSCRLRLLDANGCEMTQGIQNVLCENLFLDHDILAFMPAIDGGIRKWEILDERSRSALSAVYYSNPPLGEFVVNKYIGYIDVIVDREYIARIKTAELKLEQPKNSEY
jgi:hypothetical protein